MLQFFDVDEKYTKYLQGIDKQVLDIKYSSNNKFVWNCIGDKWF